MAITYRDAGVDIDAGNRLVERIRPLVAATSRPEILSGVGGFAGLAELPARYREPVLVSGTDGVGTKLKSAFATGIHDSVGIDLVAMSVNDVIVTGAEPLLFLDYFATGALELEVAEAVVAGIAEGCKRAGCALIGGETAELPGMYQPGEYDLAGFCLGVVEKSQIKTGSDLEAGDAVIALPSSGLHSNGHSLARKVILELLGLGWSDTPEALGGDTVAGALLEPTRIYAAELEAIEAGAGWKAAAHITGGGLVENPPRMLRSPDLAIELEAGSWTVPPIFDLIASGGVEEDEMRRTFNLGIGMLVVVAADAAERALDAVPGASRVGRLSARGDGPPVVFRAAGER